MYATSCVVPPPVERVLVEVHTVVAPPLITSSLLLDLCRSLRTRRHHPTPETRKKSTCLPQRLVKVRQGVLVQHYISTATASSEIAHRTRIIPVRKYRCPVPEVDARHRLANTRTASPKVITGGKVGAVGHQQTHEHVCV